MNDLFLRACRGEKLPTPPIWLMRQAGRYLPEYRELRKGRTMLEAVRSPELAAEITLQPIRRFGFDVAILFSDLTVAYTPMGAPFDIVEGKGPVVATPIRTPSDVDRLHRFDAKQELAFAMDTIRILKGELKVPLIGFTGAPFTLAGYLIEGGPSKDHRRTKSFMLTEPDAWHRLMELLADIVIDFLSSQMDAGADAVQVFDSWVGEVDEATYREYLLPHMQRIFQELGDKRKPVIHFGTGSAALLGVMQEAGGTVMGVDWRISLTNAATLMKPSALQGNLDPSVLLTTPEIISAKAKKIVEEGRKLPGHIFNLGHGIFPDVPLANVEALIEAVRSA